MGVRYPEALEQIEKFIKASGIRDICSGYCLGNCCSGCYESRKACHSNEGRRLSCSFFICGVLKDLFFDDHEREIYQRIRMAVMESMSEALGDSHKNPYFTINDKVIRDAFGIDIKTLNMLNKISINKIRFKTNAFIDLHRKILCTVERRKNEKESRNR